MSEPFIGEIRIWALNFAVRNWATCDGQLLQIAQNTALFSLLGTTYGGDGRTTFGLPNLQGRAPMHPGNGPGLTSRSLGQQGGSETATLTAANLPPHDHTMRALDADAQSTDPSGNLLATSNEDNYNELSAPNVPLSSLAKGSASSNLAHDNMQPYLALTFLIALVGIFPSRS